MDPPEGLIHQSELPFERDAVQCHSGKWRYVRLRRAPMEVVAECDSREAVWRIAKKLSDRPIWEEHYEKMTLVKCVPPPEVFRHPQTCFLVTDGSSIKDVTKPVKQPESHVRMKVRESEPPKTPRSASWPEQKRTTDWRLRIKKLIGKL